MEIKVAVKPGGIVVGHTGEENSFVSEAALVSRIRAISGIGEPSAAVKVALLDYLYI